MERSYNKRSRTRSRSPPPWRQQQEYSTYDRKDDRGRSHGNSGRGGYAQGRGNFPNQHQRRNQEQEDRQMNNWMSQEDDFVLKQSKKKARIRIKEDRAKLIDRLVLILSIIDPTKDPLEDDSDDIDLDIKNPIDLIDESPVSELRELEKEVEHYLVLEHHETNRTFWEAIKSICNYKYQLDSSNGHGRSIGLVSTDVDRLLGPKTLEQLQTLEMQVHQKLKSNEPIDEEYWEQLLDSIALYKAKAHLKNVYASVKTTRLDTFREQQIRLAQHGSRSINSQSETRTSRALDIVNIDTHDPLPQLKLQPEDQLLEIVEEDEFSARIERARMNVHHAGYVAGNTQRSTSLATQGVKSVLDASKLSEDYSSATNFMYDREAAKGIEEGEEVFAGEAEVVVESNPLWSGKYRPRKPKHFNRVQMGYEWNKYNQTHYDHDNPPPKVVQGYKFNIFYPDLIDKNKAPTYRIDRENGRRKGQSLAPAGQEDTCLIRFISGPPYEDIAFRIVDREWDHSAKRERGFKSSFDKGVLQLHFQFKKIYYRK